MTAETLCEESDPLICTDTSFPGSEQQLALMLQAVLKFRALLICPTGCPQGTQHTAPKEVFPVHIDALLSTNPVVGSSCTHHTHLLPKCFSAVPFSPKALTRWELSTFPAFAHMHRHQATNCISDHCKAGGLHQHPLSPHSRLPLFAPSPAAGAGIRSDFQRCFSFKCF